MIPYPELVAALERWRVRNGLPVGGGGMPPMSASYTAPAPMTPAPMTAPMTAPPRPAPMPAAKVPQRAQTDEPFDLGDADVLDEDVLAPEGGDFAMPFNVSTSAATTAPSPVFDDDEVGDERTAIGNPGEPLSPFSPEHGTGAGLDTYDADDDVLGEEDDLDPRHKS